MSTKTAAFALTLVFTVLYAAFAAFGDGAGAESAANTFSHLAAAGAGTFFGAKLTA